MFSKGRKTLKYISIFILSFGLFILLFVNISKITTKVNAVEVAIDATIIDGTDGFGPSPNTVFTTPQIGYVFYIDSGTQDLVYSKSTDGGTTWSAVNTIESATTGWTQVSVWYDQWTPGNDSGNLIHIAASDDASADIFYTYLNTDTGALKGSVITAVSGTTTITEDASGPPSITRGASGELFISGNFTSTAGGKVSKSSDGDTWTDITPSGWSSIAIDQIQLLPLITGNDIIAIKAQTATDTIVSQIYNETDDEWAGSWTNIGGLIENTTYDQWFSATVNKNNGDIHLTYASRTAHVANNITYWSMTNSERTWSQGSNIFTGNATVMMPVPFVDTNTNDVYVTYLRGALNSNVNLYNKKLTNGQTVWSNELQILSLDTVGDDYKGLRGSIGGNGRAFVTYYDDDDNVLYGSTIYSEDRPVESYIDTAINDATDHFGPSPTVLFTDKDTGYEFFVKNDTALDSTDEYGPSPAVVFTDANTGYVFYIAATSQTLAYKKTIDGGSTWSGMSTINTSTTGWTSVAVWYDQWTPGDSTGTRIHIAASDDASADIFYTYLDTSDNSLRSGGVVMAVSGTTTLTEEVDGPPSITKDGSGEIFISANFTSTVGGKISKSINNGDNWSDITPSGWSIIATNQIQILPLLTDNDLIAIRVDTANDDIDYQTYEDNVWSGTWTTISSLVENTTHDQWFSASLKKSTGDIYLSLNNNTAISTNDMEFWTFSNSARTWSRGGDLWTDNMTVQAPVPVINESTGTIYVAYIRGSMAATSKVYYKTSSDGGTTWSAESATISPSIAAGDDYRYLRGNLLSTDKIYIMWHNDDTNDIKGNTLNSPLTYDNPITGLSVVYRKTTNGGLYWDIPHSVACAQGTTNVAIWYDQWTPGDTTGSKVHIAFSDDITGDYYYTLFDTTYESNLPPVQVLLGTTITEATSGPPAITKNTAGNIFLSGQFTTTGGGKIARSTNNGESWTDITPSGWSTNQADQIQLLPLLTGGDIVAVKAQIADHTIKYQIYDEATTDAWAGSWSHIGALIDHATYAQWFSASTKKSSGDAYLAFNSNTANAANNLEFWYLDDDNRGSGFVKKTDVLSNNATILSPVPLVNEENGDIYVAYLRGTLAATMGVYYKVSTDGGTTWSEESKNLSPGFGDDHKYLKGNLLSSDRLYMAWYNDDLDDIMGNYISLDFSPIISVTVSDGIVDFGIIPPDSARSTTPSDLNKTQTATNTGNVNVDFSIKGSNTTSSGCTWTLASTNSTDQYVNQFCNATSLNCTIPPASYTPLTTSYQSIATNVLPSGSINFDLRILTPTESTCDDEQSLNITILVSQ